MVTVSLIQVIASGLICALIKQPLISTCCLNVFKINFWQRSLENFGQRKTLIINNHRWTLNTQTGFRNFVINYDFTFFFFKQIFILKSTFHVDTHPPWKNFCSSPVNSLTMWIMLLEIQKSETQCKLNLVFTRNKTNDTTVFLRQWQCLLWHFANTS